VSVYICTQERKSFSRDFLLLAAAAGALKLGDDPWHKQKLSLALPEKQKLPKESLKGKWMDRELSSEANLHQFSILILSNRKVKE